MRLRTTVRSEACDQKSRRHLPLIWLGAAFALALFAPGAAVSAHQSVNLDQCANGPFGSPQDCGTGWQNGDLNPEHSFYREGDSVPFRAILGGLSAGSHTLVIQYDTTKSGKHAYDYLTSYDRTVAGADPCFGIAGCSGAPSSSDPIPLGDNPVPPDVGLVVDAQRRFSIWNGSVTSIALGGASDDAGSQQSITVTFTTGGTNDVVLAWGGHVADEITWPPNSGAASIPGSPYHMRLLSLDGDSSGHQDRQMKTDVTTPSLVTDVAVGDESVVDNAVLVGDGKNAVSGSVAFYVCFAADGTPDCTNGGQLVSAASPVSALGTASSDAISPQEAGTYCFRAQYTPDAGAYYSPAADTNALLQHDGNHGECFTVDAELPGSSVATHIHVGDAVDPDSALVGSTVHDVAVVSAFGEGSTPTGTVVFTLYSGTGCADGHVVSTSGALSLDSGGTATSPDTTLPEGGLSYRAAYGGSNAYGSSTGLCENLSSFNAPPPPPPPVTPPAPPATPPAAPVTPVVPPTIYLAITKAAAPSPVSLGSQITWTLVVTNNGPSNATGVKVADPLPSGMTFVSATASEGTCSGTQLVSCDLGNLANGASVTILIRTTAARTGSVTNTATVVGNEAETNVANNSASAPAAVRGPFKPPAVACTAVAISPKSIFVGRAVILTLKVSQGGKAAAGVRVRLQGRLGLVTKATNKQGIVRTKVQATKAGIVSFAPVARAKCTSPRIGVVGAFTPPVTG
jgi:uncharacterized repeat protein (TIGR01451 family)